MAGRLARDEVIPMPNHNPDVPASRPPSSTEPLLLRVPEVAQQLAMSRTATYRLVASGALPSLLIGGCRRVSREQLNAFVAGLAATDGGVR